MKNTVAIVPVRSGSKRVTGKNTRSFANTTLLDIKLETLKNVSGLANIIVSSDDENMLSIAKSHGVDTHKREKYYASDECTNSEFFSNLAFVLQDYENIMYSPVTCPLIDIDTYRSALLKFEDCENLVTVSLIKHHLWLDNKPLNYDIKNSPNSQDLPNIMQITYGISLISRELMLKFRNIVCDHPEFYILDEIESLDIDTEFDFMITEHVYKTLRSLP